MKRNSRFKCVLRLEKASTKICKFQSRLVTLAAPIPIFWGKRLVKPSDLEVSGFIQLWECWVSHGCSHMRISHRCFLCLGNGKMVSNSKLSPFLLQVSTLTKLCPPQENSLSSSLSLNRCLIKESYSLSVGVFYSLRDGGVTINAKKQQVCSIQALKIIVETVDSVAQRLRRSVGFRPCVVCLVLT